MATLSCARLDERMEACGPVSPEPLLGTWLNTNSATHGITKAVLAEKDGQVVLHIFADNDPELSDWGEAVASVFAAGASSTEAMAFSAFYDFGFMETQLQGHVRQGVLIIAKFDRFKDNSARSNYFSKEFFYSHGRVKTVV
ncbi:MAG TPA: hypothetical protein VI685_23225 [Candidatus Angelobacter sp.]